LQAKRNEDFRKHVKLQEEQSKQSQKNIDEKKGEIQTLKQKLYEMGKVRITFLDSKNLFKKKFLP
jgi:hypothetical protein